MNYLISMLLFFFTTASHGYDIKNNPIYHSILVLNPKIDKRDAFKYSNIIYKYSSVYQIDPFLIVAITRQESYINLNTVREVIISDIHLDKKTNKFIKKVEITDFCMMQINKQNVISKNLDPERLIRDPDYCIHEGIKILSFFKKFNGSEEFWWTRYNSPNDTHREIYKKYVLSHYSKISEIVNKFSKLNKTKNLLIAFDYAYNSDNL